MKLKEDNIDIYNNSAIILNKKTPFIINSWIIILIILLLLFVILSFIPFNIYKTYNGYIILEDNKSYISLLIDESDFPINKDNKLYIKKNKYKYRIINIEDNNVILEVKLKNNIQINNNIVTVNIQKNRTTLFKIIKNKIKKGFDLWKN